jgi:hypothetical protein
MPIAQIVTHRHMGRAKMDTWRAHSKVVINEQGKHFDNPDVLAQHLVTNAVRYTLHP